jgi:hypothetical protein
MNKYQEALNFIESIVIDELSNGYDNPKYFRDFNPGIVGLMQELVNKETPTKLNVNVDKEYCRCKCNLDFWEIDLDYFKRKGLSYCPNCGQKLDWTNNE